MRSDRPTAMEQATAIGNMATISTLRRAPKSGKAWLPLVDVAKAFGAANYAAPTNLRPGESIQLNFTKNLNAEQGARWFRCREKKQKRQRGGRIVSIGEHP